MNNFAKGKALYTREERKRFGNKEGGYIFKKKKNARHSRLVLFSREFGMNMHFPLLSMCRLRRDTVRGSFIIVRSSYLVASYSWRFYPPVIQLQIRKVCTLHIVTRTSLYDNEICAAISALDRCANVHRAFSYIYVEAHHGTLVKRDSLSFILSTLHFFFAHITRFQFKSRKYWLTFSQIKRRTIILLFTA